MAEHLIHVNNWFSKDEADRAEQVHHSMFKPSEPKTTVASNNNPVTSTEKKPQMEVAKSIIMLEVAPWELETDLDAMEKCIRSIEADGLLWGQSKRIPIAYGLYKLQISCVVEDDKIGTDFLEEKISEFDEYVQSVYIPIINKV